MERIITIITTCLFLFSCGDKEHEVGQYIYVDCFNTVHIDRVCASNLAENPKTKEERIANMQGVEFIDTCSFTGTYETNFNHISFDFCPRCVDDVAYSHLSAIIQRNRLTVE